MTKLQKYYTPTITSVDFRVIHPFEGFFEVKRTKFRLFQYRIILLRAITTVKGWKSIFSPMKSSFWG